MAQHQKRAYLSLNVDSRTEEFFERRVDHHSNNDKRSETRVIESSKPTAASVNASVITRPFEKTVEKVIDGRRTIERERSESREPKLPIQKKKKSIENKYDISDL